MGSDGAVGTGDSGSTTTTTTPTGGPADQPTDDPNGYAGYGGHIDAGEGQAIAEQISNQLSAQGISIPEDARVIVDPQRGVVIQLSTDDVTFATGSGTLTDEGRAALDTLVPALEAIDNPIEIDGHTDDTGSYDVNWDLSGARAAAAVKYLQNAHGIAPDRLHYSGYGETKPIADNATPEGQRANRRVEVVIVVDPTATPTASGPAATPTTGTATPRPAPPRRRPALRRRPPPPPRRRRARPPATTPTTAASTATTAGGPRATSGVVLQPGSLAREAQD